MGNKSGDTLIEKESNESILGTSRRKIFSVENVTSSFTLQRSQKLNTITNTEPVKLSQKRFYIEKIIKKHQIKRNAIFKIMKAQDKIPRKLFKIINTKKRVFRLTKKYE